MQQSCCPWAHQEGQIRGSHLALLLCRQARSYPRYQPRFEHLFPLTRPAHCTRLSHPYMSPTIYPGLGQPAQHERQRGIPVGHGRVQHQGLSRPGDTRQRHLATPSSAGGQHTLRAPALQVWITAVPLCSSAQPWPDSRPEGGLTAPNEPSKRHHSSCQDRQRSVRIRPPRPLYIDNMDPTYGQDESRFDPCNRLRGPSTGSGQDPDMTNPYCRHVRADLGAPRGALVISRPLVAPVSPEAARLEPCMGVVMGGRSRGSIWALRGRTVAEMGTWSTFLVRAGRPICARLRVRTDRHRDKSDPAGSGQILTMLWMDEKWSLPGAIRVANGHEWP